MFVYQLAHKFIAKRYDCEAEFRIWKIERYGFRRSAKFPARVAPGLSIKSLPVGIILSIILAFLSRGKFPFAAVGTTVLTSSTHHRLGRDYVRLTEFEESKIALAGPLSMLIVAIIFKLFSTINPSLNEVVFITSLIAVFNMLPIPHLDGTKVFFGGKVFFIFTFILVLGLAFLLYLLESVVATILLAVIFAIVLSIIYYYFKEYRS